MKRALVQATAQRPLADTDHPLPEEGTGRVSAVSPEAEARSSVASFERTLRTRATSSLVSGTGATWVGPLPASTSLISSVTASMYATRPLLGLATQTYLPVATGAP